MTLEEAADQVADRADDAILAAALFAVDPVGLGGVLVRARSGPAREAWLAWASGADGAADATALEGARWRRMPLHAEADRLLGGLDLAATLSAGRPVRSAGLFAEAAGGVLVAPSAERLTLEAAALLGAVLDDGAVGVVALDEGDAADERAPASLADRLALWVDLDGLRADDLAASDERLGVRSAIASARRRRAEVAVPNAIVEGLAASAAALGAGSLRAPILALRAARAAAALAGRTVATEADATLAARLVLGPRATRAPELETPDDASADEPPNDPPQEPPQEPPNETGEDPRAAPPEDREEPSDDAPSPLEDPAMLETLLAAAQARLPTDLLSAVEPGAAPRGAGGAGGAGATRRAPERGRPAGARPGDPRRARLDLVETLRRAAPWQPLRRRGAAAAEPRRMRILKDDLRVKRFKRPAEAAIVVVVDASGSAAFQRLAEAKGAVELLLGQAYVRRDHVALIAFRGEGAEVLLPPTRALARAKRALAGLPGGGATPLAAGLDAAATLVEQIRRRGWSPTVAVLTDGRANIRRDGSVDRAGAVEDALAAGRALASAGVGGIVIDTAPRPRDAARGLAEAMRARYLPLPYAGAEAVSTAVAAVAHAEAAR